MNRLIVVLTAAVVFAAVPAADAAPPTLSLTMGTPPTFGAFTPGIVRDYDAANTTANVTSSAETATLTVHDPTGISVGHLVNGSSVLPQPLQARAAGGPTFADIGGADSPLTLRTYSGRYCCFRGLR